jgi:hypothetical protein
MYSLLMGESKSCFVKIDGSEQTVKATERKEFDDEKNVCRMRQ